LCVLIVDELLLLAAFKLAPGMVWVYAGDMRRAVKLLNLEPDSIKLSQLTSVFVYTISIASRLVFHLLALIAQTRF
jgi:hypothetical protein